MATSTTTEATVEKLSVFDPYETDEGRVGRRFYHPLIGYGTVEASNDSLYNVATITFLDLLGGPSITSAQPNEHNVTSRLSDTSRDLDPSRMSAGHELALELVHRALGLEIAGSAASAVY